LQLNGIYPALFTPFDTSGNVSEGTLCRLVDVLVKSGVDGLYLCGGTGEGLLLSSEERMRVAEIVVREAGKRVKVVVHVGSVATEDCVTLAHHALDIGVDAVSAVPPFYYGVSLDGMATHYERIAACGLPVILYNIPTAVQITVTPEMMRRFIQIEGVCGIKFSSYQLFHLWQIAQLDSGRLSVFSGNDEVMLGAFAMGAHGAIGLTLNLMPRLYTQLYEKFSTGNLHAAKCLQDYANRVIEILIRYPVIPAAKVAMRLLKYDCGNCRGPLETLSQDQTVRLERELREIGFFERNFGLD
jgi:N-acetylneuraminate lyase